MEKGGAVLILWVSKISAESLGQIEIFITYSSNDLQGRDCDPHNLQLWGSENSSHPTLQGPVSQHSCFWHKIHLFHTAILSPVMWTCPQEHSSNEVIHMCTIERTVTS